ncbi:uncharacterized protein LOC130962904 [Arachis stenosperma]|uniref:uncharacterized protein LOC130962904 n=1 Tax=Arachis stenosperma TaxID=217475 RepID=UPI0025AC7D38|nr:uncharacterized protein LOC130962904 [Arachis stenosperma]
MEAEAVTNAEVEAVIESETETQAEADAEEEDAEAEAEATEADAAKEEPEEADAAEEAKKSDAKPPALGHPSPSAATERPRTGDALHPRIPLFPQPPITRGPAMEHARTSSTSDPSLSPSCASLLASCSSS